MPETMQGTLAVPIPRVLRLPSKPNVPVLVLAANQLVFHHGTVGVIRSLGRMGVPVYSVIKDRFTRAAVSKYVTAAFIWKTCGLNTPQFLEGMEAIGKHLPAPAIVVPTDDVAAILVAEQAALLKAHFLLPQQPPMLPRTLANKKDLYLLCKKIGAACPETVFPSSLAGIDEFVKHAAFPVVLKAAESWLLPQGVRTTAIARTPAELYAIYRSMNGDRGATIVLQEYIAPAYGEDWFYHGYRNPQSNCCVGFTGRKLRSYPPSAGPTTLGKSAPNARLQQEAEALLESLSYCGIMDLDYRFDNRDGQYKLVDFNPRIGAQFRLFEDSAGLDVARALYLDLTGKSVPRSSALQDRTFIVEFHDLAAGFGYIREGGLTVHQWWLSLKGTREFAWFSLDDPFPFLAMCIRLVFRMIEKMLHLSPRLSGTDGAPRYVKSLSHHHEPLRRAWRANAVCWSRSILRGIKELIRDERGYAQCERSIMRCFSH
jgi:D-aspartate ligase